MDDHPPPEFRIHQTAQESLSSDNPPQRNFDEEIKEMITDDCPDWNSPDVPKTYVIPPTFPEIPTNRANVGERTEKHVYDILTQFGQKTNQPMVVVHSYQFKELVQCFENGTKSQKEWRKGEHDFVVIHRSCGVIFFQVKAAETTGSAYRKAVQQINKDQDSLTAAMKRLSLKKDKGKIEEEMRKYPGFVVMPNCSRELAGNKLGCFKEECQSVGDFQEWWENNIHRSGVFTQEMYELMVIRFAAPLLTTCLQSAVLDNTHKKLLKLTKDQLSILTRDSPKQYIMGPAGSGKTWLLMEKANQLARIKRNDRILIMCYNRPLSVHLAKEFHQFPNVSVKTFVSLLFGIKGELTSLNGMSEYEKKKLVFDCIVKLSSMPEVANSKYKYEHVFVDEGQDMYGDWWLLVDLLHMDSDADRRYKWVFFDNNQNVQIGPKTNIPCKIVNNAKEMNRVVRNTLNIFECSQKYLSPTLGAEISHGVTGPLVKWVDCLSFYMPSYRLWQGVDIVRKEICNLHRDHVTMSNIVVLTCDKSTSDEVCQCLLEGSPCISTQNAEDAIKFPNHAAVVVDSIRRFKGLERQVVILLDPPFDDEMNIELNYVGMSRCFCLLIIVTSQGKRQVYNDFTLEC